MSSKAKSAEKVVQEIRRKKAVVIRNDAWRDRSRSSGRVFRSG